MHRPRPLGARPRPRPRRRRRPRRHPSPPRPRTTPQISKTILVVAFRRHPPLDAALPRVFASRSARARAVAARPRNRGTRGNSAPPFRLGRVRRVPILVREDPPRARDVRTSRPRARGAIDRRARDVLERGAGESRARRTREGRPVDNPSSSPRDDSTASARERRRDRRAGANSRSRGRV